MTVSYLVLCLQHRIYLENRTAVLTYYLTTPFWSPLVVSNLLLICPSSMSQKLTVWAIILMRLWTLLLWHCSMIWSLRQCSRKLTCLIIVAMERYSSPSISHHVAWRILAFFWWCNVVWCKNWQLHSLQIPGLGLQTTLPNLWPIVSWKTWSRCE